MQIRLRKEALVAGAVIASLLVILAQLVALAHANSATWDEADHTYAGYMQWKHGDFGLNPQHPPLIKFLATLPLLSMQMHEPPLHDQPYRLQEVRGGKAFVFGNDANSMLFRARMAAAPLTLLLALLVFFAAREMFGTGAGLLALFLLSFDPTLLAHSALVTTDAGQACFLFWTIYAFYRYNNRPTLPRLLVVGLAAGLSLASKHSAVLLFPMLLLLAAAEIVLRRRRGQAPATQPASGRLGFALLLITGVAVTILWASYGFRYAPRVNGLPLNPSMQAMLARVPGRAEAHVLGLVDRLHLLPQSYTYGFAHVLIQSKAFTSYLLGTIYPHPVWFYFPVAMLIKSTLSFLILLAVAIWATATGGLRSPREVLYLLVPAGVYMAFAMAGGMNIGVRHVLPIYIFLTVLIAGAAWALIQRNRRLWLPTVTFLLLAQAASVLHAFPAYVSYANEAFGGPANVHKYLSDSSADWGQQLKAVRRYLDTNGIHNCWFAYFGEGVADYTYYGIPCRPLITADSLYFDDPHPVPPAIDGPVLLSAGVLSGFEFGPGPLNPYAQFQQLQPSAVIDNGVFVFRGHFELPLAAALSHVQQSGVLLAQKHVSEALAEAREAEALAPDSAAVNRALGEALDAAGQRADALLFYRRALTLATTVEPAFQQGMVAPLQQRLEEAQSPPLQP